MAESHRNEAVMMSKLSSFQRGEFGASISLLGLVEFEMIIQSDKETSYGAVALIVYSENSPVDNMNFVF